VDRAFTPLSICVGSTRARRSGYAGREPKIASRREFILGSSIEGECARDEGLALHSPVAHPAREVRVLMRPGVGEGEGELGVDFKLCCFAKRNKTYPRAHLRSTEGRVSQSYPYPAHSATSTALQARRGLDIISKSRSIHDPSRLHRVRPLLGSTSALTLQIYTAGASEHSVLSGADGPSEGLKGPRRRRDVWSNHGQNTPNLAQLS
jgi:hypothetical protein